MLLYTYKQKRFGIDRKKLVVEMVIQAGLAQVCVPEHFGYVCPR